MALKRELVERGPGATHAAEARYYNRELSWLEFNARVLALADNEDFPLLERVKFLAIFSTNLDEFFQIRVSGIRDQVAAGVIGASPDGMSPQEQLDAIRERVCTLCAKRGRILTKLIPVLAGAGIAITDWGDLPKADRRFLSRYFDDHVLPILTPLAVDPAHPFPYISNLSLNLAVVVRDPKTHARRFARVKVPNSLQRFVPLPDRKTFVALEQVIAAHADELFPGMVIVSIHPFRVARDADVEVEVAEADDLLSAIQEGLRRRDRSPEVVQLEVDAGMPRAVSALLIEELDLAAADVYSTKPMLNLGDLMELTKLDRPDLKLEPWTGVTQRVLAPVLRGERDIFSLLREGDVLVQHPYDSFETSVAMFIEESAQDPKVLAIKQSLYRTSVEDTQIVRALIRAAASGKQTVAMIELTARFDEQANIGWARMLEQADVHVVYGVVGLKTHAKCTLVVREEGAGIRRYCHIGTGNYHPGTATLYEDIGLFTADADIGSDVSDLFNYITGYSRQDDYRTILVAPLSLRSQLLEMIKGEEQKGREGRIVMKMNSLVDPQTIEALYSASRAGVQIDLVIRGICCLKPREPNLSENIRVRSIVGRFLEHSRIFRFGKDGGAGPPRYFIGSADIMPRNLDHRVECVTPVEDPALIERLEEILQVNLSDDVLAWELGHRGWSKVHTRKGIDTHVALQRIARGRNGWTGRP